MEHIIVADSSANLTSLGEVPFASVPLHIVVGSNTFVDDPSVDIAAMQRALKAYKGPSSTSCPSPEDWLRAFGDADVVFCVTITSALSGAWSSAMIAKQLYEESHPEKRVYIFDTLSTGPEMTLIVEKLQQLIAVGMSPDAIEGELRSYQQRSHLYFSLASLQNFAKNGRVDPLLAKGIGLLGLRIVGTANAKGQLQPLDKRRGEAHACDCLVQHMKRCGYCGGRVIVSHTDAAAGAALLMEKIRAAFGQVDGTVMCNRALCSYYAEPGSILLGFET